MKKTKEQISVLINLVHRLVELRDTEMDLFLKRSRISQIENDIAFIIGDHTEANSLVTIVLWKEEARVLNKLRRAYEN